MRTTIPGLHRPAPTVLGVWAHPDDEAYLSAGLMLRAVAAGGRVACIHATRGERGTDDPVRWPPSRLARTRERELAAALATLGVQRHTFLGLADGRCAEADPAAPVTAITDAIAQLRPDVIVTFGPDGVTGHPDHVAVGGWATTAWRRAGTGSLLYAVQTRSMLERDRDMYDELGLPYDEGLYVPDEEVAVRIRLRPDELDRKRRCLAAHASQTTALAAEMGEARYRRWVEEETFRRPRPAEHHRAPVAAEVPA